jgi:hypothetical protein
MNGERLALNIKQWIAARVEDQMKNGRRIMSERLIDELAGVFHLKPVHEKLEKKLKAEIERAKRRIRKREIRWRDLRGKMADDLIVPENVIDRWRKKKFFKPCTPQVIEDYISFAMELIYCKIFELTDEDIPDDPSQPLWNN